METVLSRYLMPNHFENIFRYQTQGDSLACAVMGTNIVQNFGLKGGQACDTGMYVAGCCMMPT